jgi:phosphatidylglycerophosphate synthase
MNTLKRYLKSYKDNYLNDITKIKASYKAGENEALFTKYFYRPLSFPLTPFFLRLGFSANGVTCLNLLFGVLAATCFVFGSYTLWRIGAIIFVAEKLLDYVDGNIARVKDNASYFGKFLDGVIDTFVLMIIPILMGWGLYLAFNKSRFIIMAVSALFLFSFAVGVMTRFSFVYYWMRVELYEDRERMASFDKKRGHLKQGNFSYFHDYNLLGLFATVFFDLREYFYYGYILLLGLCSLNIAYRQLSNSIILLNIHRKSRHST